MSEEEKRGIKNVSGKRNVRKGKKRRDAYGGIEGLEWLWWRIR